jgi:hypothetical protein
VGIGGAVLAAVLGLLLANWLRSRVRKNDEKP